MYSCLFYLAFLNKVQCITSLSLLVGTTVGYYCGQSGVTLFTQTYLVACGALAASISVGIVIPSTWFVYLYKQTVSITVVVMGTEQFNDKTTHRQQLKTGFVQKWENRSPGLFQDYSRTFSFFKDSISSQFCITQRFKVHFFQSESAK